jgi:thiosulfate/3-mercaptopyruvate sulfurtransferase
VLPVPVIGAASTAHSWFVLHELLGYPRVRNYDGSWTEWGSMVGVPIER